MKNNHLPPTLMALFKKLVILLIKFEGYGKRIKFRLNIHGNIQVQKDFIHLDYFDLEFIIL